MTDDYITQKIKEARFPLCIRTSGWRFRYFNKFRVYSIDHNFDRSMNGEELVNDFVARASCKTPIHEWFKDNPFSAENLCVFYVSCDALTFHEELSVRFSTTESKNSPLRLLTTKSNQNEFSLNVVVLRQGFCDRRIGDEFYEYTILGVVQREKFSSITVADVTLIGESHTLDSNMRKSLSDLRLPRVNITPFGSESVPVKMETLEENRLISFFIRWHAARRSTRTNSFFDKVIGATQLKSSEEFDSQLFNHTVKFFSDSSAAESLLGDQSLLNKLLTTWNNNLVTLPHRIWMVRQLCDAIDYCIENHVVARGATARRFFVRKTLLPAFAFLAPQIDVVKVTSNSVEIDFCSPALCFLQFNINTSLSKYKSLPGEAKSVSVEGGNLVVPMSVACRLFVDLYRCALEKIASTTLVEFAKNEAMLLVDESVLPVNGTDVYKRVRTVRYDDYPIEGYFHKLIMSTNSMSAASSAASTSTAQQQQVPEAFRTFNLPIECGMVEADASESTVSTTDSGASIPLYKSGSFISVSRGALHDVCSNQPIVDIEDIAVDGAEKVTDEENACMNLYKNHALPLCVRQLTRKYVETSEYLLFEPRGFVYRFFNSLKMEDVTHEKIREFMLLNSTEAAVRTKHAYEINSLPKSFAKWESKMVRERVEKGETEEHAKKEVSCFGGCSKHIKDGMCPYQRSSLSLAGADDELRKKIKEANNLLKNDDDAIDRIIGELKRTKIPQVGCLQEYAETRRKINIDVEPKVPSDLSFTKPKHYVYACADHKQRCDCK